MGGEPFNYKQYKAWTYLLLCHPLVTILVLKSWMCQKGLGLTVKPAHSLANNHKLLPMIIPWIILV